jgi:hypothetical protein
MLTWLPNISVRRLDISSTPPTKVAFAARLRRMPPPLLLRSILPVLTPSWAVHGHPIAVEDIAFSQPNVLPVSVDILVV